MKSLNISTKIGVYTYKELDQSEKKLIDAAKAAALHAYAPYSRFHVGSAVLLANEAIVSGNNQENAAYPSGLCAERTALFYANARYPEEAVVALAVAAYTDGDFTEEPVPPCGACRQVILEAQNRYKQPVCILLYGKKSVYRIEKISDLLPLSFDAASMGSE
ncbi:MAG: cytidine deaminase [Dysgonamonadaceae bacterium]|jgi:cytidine deaminase|nr:cytidine deaminase [Dysgonamonadaceae bacterium]